MIKTMLKLILLLPTVVACLPQTPECPELEDRDVLSINCLDLMETPGTIEYAQYQILLDNREHNTLGVSRLALNGILGACILNNIYGKKETL
jgi:hypothetical protein